MDVDDYDDDIEIADDTCPKCGHYTLRRDCSGIGCDEGQIDGYEYDDPLWFSPGETYTCDTCNGLGYFHWCPACGLDLRRRPGIAVHVSPKIQPATLRALADVGRRLWNWLAH